MRRPNFCHCPNRYSYFFLEIVGRSDVLTALELYAGKSVFAEESIVESVVGQVVVALNFLSVNEQLGI